MSKNIIHINTDYLSTRLEYTVHQIFSRFQNCEVFIHDKTTRSKEFHGIQIDYDCSYSNLNHFKIPQNSFIHEEGIVFDFKPKPINSGNIDILFPLDDLGVDLNFDIFSAVFYMLSRYEEYQAFKPDQHGRFPSTESLAHKYGFVDYPVVDIWIDLFKNGLEKKYPNVTFRYKKKFHIQPSFDIDQAWYFKNRHFFQNSKSLAKSFFTGKWGQVLEKANVWTGRIKDPYDNYDKITAKFISKTIKNPLFFVLMSDYSNFDSYIDLNSNNFKNLVAGLGERFTVGIHPSYETIHNNDMLMQEKSLLSDLLSSTVLRSRQHFLRLDITKSYSNLIKTGILHDYTMGFADNIGFRAGTSYPFKWFNLAENKSTNLTIHPFQVMDTTLKKYMHLKPQEAIFKIQHMKYNIKKVSGQFCFIWHNSSFYEKESWKGWNEVYKELFELE